MNWSKLYFFKLIFHYKFNQKGKYKVEIFDPNSNQFIPSVSGLGMHVDVRDPDDKSMLSRVSHNHFLELVHLFTIFNKML